MKLWKNGFNLAILLALAWALTQSFMPFSTAKTERTKVIKKDFDAKAEVVVAHQYGPLTIKKSNDGRIHLEAEVLATGSDEESIEKVLNRFDVAASESGDRLSLAMMPKIKSWNCVNNHTTIVFDDGEKVKGLNDVKVSMVLYVADPKQLILSNKYQNIELDGDFSADLNVELYSGDLIAGNLSGSLNLDLKYGKAKLGSVGKAKWVVYDSEVLAGPVQEAVVSSKYSEYRLGPVAGDLTLETYDEEWRMGSIGGRLVLDDKYSEFRMGDIGSAVIKMFDGDVEAGRVGDLTIGDTKYSVYKLAEVGKLTIGNTFDDEYALGKAASIIASDSKYTEYRLNRLTDEFSLQHSFDDEISIATVEPGCSRIWLDAKYTNLSAKIAEGAGFGLSLNMKYGDFNYPENRVSISKQIEKNGDLTLEGKLGDGGTGVFQVTGFDNDISLQ